jgi:hypothetical protein
MDIEGMGVDRPAWVTEDIDLDRPSIARVYDFFLGGSHNFAVDRAMAEQLLKMAPDVAEIMQANRAFLRRAVRFMVSEGITQFLDIGSGIPTVGNVHEVAQQANPEARVVYVDIDPVAYTHSRAMLEGNDKAAIVRADLRDPDAILGSPEVANLLDLSRPVGLLIVSVLHFIEDTLDPQSGVARLRDAMPAGSFLAISHAVAQSRPGDLVERFGKMYQQTGAPAQARTHDEIAAFFGEFTLVEPGLVFLPLWRPDSPAESDDRPEWSVSLAGVGQKP